ncbi:hypothetical protein WN982_12760 [Paraburkholderia sp. IMGN_8]|uniref:hypothetical protein n=1 Tax=Paraburkholderia sp. IMGN_8 TaxID=3136564 RepID=UPI003100D662
MLIANSLIAADTGANHRVVSISVSAAARWKVSRSMLPPDARKAAQMAACYAGVFRVMGCGVDRPIFTKETKPCSLSAPDALVPRTLLYSSHSESALVQNGMTPASERPGQPGRHADGQAPTQTD